jgi:hypothetical protein
VIEVLPGLPENVIGIEAVGKVTDDDYKDVIVPLIDKKQQAHDKVRLIYVLGPEFDGYSAGALWDDAKIATKKPGSWEKLAVVSDEQWITRTLSLVSWAFPGEMKVFPMSERAAATTWIAA